MLYMYSMYINVRVYVHRSVFCITTLRTYIRMYVRTYVYMYVCTVVLCSSFHCMYIHTYLQS